MTQMIAPQVLTFDTPTPLKGTLLDAAKVTTGRTSWLDTTALSISYNCLDTAQTATFPCPVPDPLPDDKEFAGPEWVNGFAFAVYSGIVCKSVGFDTSEGNTELARVWDAKESVGVARALMAYRFQALAGPGGWDAPASLGSGAKSPGVALAILEGNASYVYAGSPTIHMGRTVASILTEKGFLEFRGDTLYTKLGSKVAADGGYESPNTGPDGTEEADPTANQWMYVTGNVSIVRGEPFQQEVLNPSTNEIAILRERTYLAAVDCYAAAIEVNVE